MPIEWVGGWAGSTGSIIPYYPQEIVNYDNIVYVVKPSVSLVPIGSPPPSVDPTNWSVFVAGVTGQAGATGPAGATGAAGSSGTSGTGGGGGSSLSVVDFSSGQTFSSISTMIFKGGVVSTPTGTASSVSVANESQTVTVWIPAPNYVSYFSPSFGTGTSRYVSEPTTNGFTGVSTPGYFGVGNWSTLANFNASTTRTTINTTGTFTAFTETEFACYNTGTTMSFTVYKEDGSVLYSIQNYVINVTGSTSSNGLTLTVNSFQADSDRYKANVTGTIAMSTVFPNGGRFSWNVTHHNGEGAGNAGAGIYSFTSGDFFFDNDGSTSNASISSGVNFDELSATTVQYSGVRFYAVGSTFALTASGISNINDMSFPTTKQIDMTCTNLAVSTTHNGYADGSKSGVGTALTGWSINWNSSGLTFSRTATVNTTSNYIPGYSTNNTISVSATSNVTATLYDWSTVGSSQSVSRLMLFDTYSPSSVTFNNNPLDSESGRLSSFGVLSNGSATFSSTTSIASTDDLQYIFGRVIYPQTNFTQFYPTFNWTASVNYSSLTGSTRAFTIITDYNTGNTTPVTFADFRWHVTSYGKDASYVNSFSNGIFTLNSNFVENDLHYDGVDSIAGNGDLVLLVGFDSTSTNTTPDRFLYISADPVTYNGRTAPITYNLDVGTESSKTIQFSKGTLNTVIKKVWLFIGYKNSVRGKNLRITNIALTA